MTLEGYILSSTKKSENPGAQDKSWDDLRQDACLLSEGSLDAEALLISSSFRLVEYGKSALF